MGEVVKRQSVKATGLSCSCHDGDINFFAKRDIKSGSCRLTIQITLASS